MSKLEVIAREIDKWLLSQDRAQMVTGEKYYRGDHDILREKRTVIGDDGKLKEVDNLPDTRIVDNQYARIVDQKVNYSVGNQITVQSDDKEYQSAVQEVLDVDFMKAVRVLTTNAFNTSIGWLYPYYSPDGSEKLKFKVFDSTEILPFWKDAEHTELDFAVRTYVDEVYEGQESVSKQRVEIYAEEGIYYFDLEDEGMGIPMLNVSTDFDPFKSYIYKRFTDGKEEKVIPHSWGRIPLIPFKYNDKEIPLISRVKSIQDALNRITSNFVNNTLEDPRNSILVVHNYDGEDLGTFRANLAQYGAVKVRSAEGAKGGVDILTVDLNPENYKAILRQLKSSLIENARGVDSKDEALSSGRANEMNIQSMYNDIDLDASSLEREFAVSLNQLMFFVNQYLKTKEGIKIKEDSKVEFRFNRDILMNESEKITNFVNSYGRISDETAVANHPWVSKDKIEEELERMMDEQEDELSEFVGKVRDMSQYNDKKKDDRKADIKNRARQGEDTRGD